MNVENAGPGQNYLKVEGHPDSVSRISAQLSSMNLNKKTDWYFLNDEGGFQKYTENESNLIENSFYEGTSQVQIHGNSYTIFFGQNGNPHTQLSNTGYIYRLVRRGTEALQLHYGQNDEVWYWTEEFGNQLQWTQYEPEASKLIEYYYQQFLLENGNVQLSRMDPNERKNYAKSVSTLVSGTSGFAYMMDFVNMAQTNEKTGRWRGVRRGNQGGVLRVSQVKAEPIPWIPHPVLK